MEAKKPTSVNDTGIIFTNGEKDPNTAIASTPLSQLRQYDRTTNPAKIRKGLTPKGYTPQRCAASNEGQ